MMTSLELTQPSQAESEAMGLRDWPSTVVTGGGLNDKCDGGARRYVLEGSGTVAVAPGGEPIDVVPNTLISVPGEAELRWELADGVDEMVLLTPEYKGPPLVPIAAAFFLTFAALIAVSSGGA